MRDNGEDNHKTDKSQEKNSGKKFLVFTYNKLLE